MLQGGPFKSTDFQPDIPEEAISQFANGKAEGPKRESARDIIQKEEEEKADYQKRRVKEEQEIVCSFFVLFILVFMFKDKKYRQNIDKIQDLHKLTIQLLIVK